MLKQIKNKKIFLLFLIVVLCFSTFVQAADIEEEVSTLQDQIKSKQSRIEELKSEISIYNKNLDKYRSQAASLTNQIVILNNQIAKAEKEIELNEAEIEGLNLDIKDTEEKIDLNTQQTATQNLRLGEFLNKLYRLDQKDELEVILTHSSIAEFFNQAKNLETIQAQVSDTLERLKILKAQMLQQKANLEIKKADLEQLQRDLEAAQEKLLSQRNAKAGILTDTRNSERQFSSLVSQLKSEQASINADIVSLEKNIRQKLALKEQQAQYKLSDSGFSWPVPNKGITAYFHDPDYPFRYIFEHPAIDIRAGQGSVIKAPADGYVGRVADNGYGYSYLMLSHANGFSTVYGHVSKFLVEPDQFVAKGETVALVGGSPGTRGAGRLTTGPHLHFEIRKNGIPVNPLNYLP